MNKWTVTRVGGLTRLSLPRGYEDLTASEVARLIDDLEQICPDSLRPPQQAIAICERVIDRASAARANVPDRRSY